MEILWTLIVGAVAGWLAGLIMRTNNGVLVTIILGLIGGFVGGWLFGLLDFSVGEGIIGEIVVAAIGAVILVWVYRLIKK